MKKLLIIDRDGTIISEVMDETIDSLDKVSFLPGVIGALKTLCDKTDYELLMVSNQDGLGSADYPMERFMPAHHFVMDILEGEGIFFKDVLIDGSYPEDDLPTRKPGTALLLPYMNGEYDFASSWVIGDRESDMQLAKNLGAKSIFIGKESSQASETVSGWQGILDILTKPARKVTLERNTKETQIKLSLDPDGSGISSIDSGLGFLDHMLTLFAKHGSMDLELKASGDLNVDEHHTIEDIAICLGQALRSALGDKRGIERYGYLLPMDESLAQVALDFSGRPYFDWDVVFHTDYTGDVPTAMYKHFFRSFSDESGCNLHISAKGENDHHIIEGVFKAVARACKQAVKRTSDDLPSTKGVLA